VQHTVIVDGWIVKRLVDGCAGSLLQIIPEINGIHSVLFGMQARAFCPYLSSIHRILIPVVDEGSCTDGAQLAGARSRDGAPRHAAKEQVHSGRGT
jgi:hypothetical protein